MECYDPPSGTKKDGDTSYYYTSRDGMEGDVSIGDGNTALGSILASGEDPKYDPSGSDSGAKPTTTAETIPGLSGGGNEGLPGADASGPAGSQATGANAGGIDFIQGSGSSDASTVVAGSAVALLGFFIAALLM